MGRSRSLLLLLSLYLALASLASLLSVKPALYGLSTILGTTILGTTVLGTTVLGTTALGSISLVKAYANALAMGQLAISLLCIGMLTYLELTDPSYGKMRRAIEELRKSWLAPTAILVVFFFVIVIFKVWFILTRLPF